MSYGMGYYGGGDDGWNADPYEEQDQFEEQPQPRRRGGQSLRSYAQGVQAENAELKRKLREAEEAIQDLVGDGSQQGPGYAPQNGVPQSTVSPEGIQAMQSMQQVGAQGAPPMGSDREMANRIQNAVSPEELMAILRSQGNMNGTQSYNGQGWQ
ncbi:hypothetical protein [Streptomyces sp. NPDC091299]|uniref:hypothetical protein n=1 Tax=Streptomyces sp. NPDC091299 TaxID=3155302 RepID=UPI00343D8F7F